MLKFQWKFYRIKGSHLKLCFLLEFLTNRRTQIVINANGEKLKPLVIGKSCKPTSFRKFNLEPNKIKKIDKMQNQSQKFLLNGGQI